MPVSTAMALPPIAMARPNFAKSSVDTPPALKAAGVRMSPGANSAGRKFVSRVTPGSKNSTNFAAALADMPSIAKKNKNMPTSGAGNLVPPNPSCIANLTTWLKARNASSDGTAAST